METARDLAMPLGLCRPLAAFGLRNRSLARDPESTREQTLDTHANTPADPRGGRINWGLIMSRKAWLIAIGLAILLLGIEIGVRSLQSAKSSVQISNLGDTLLENLVVSFAGSQVGVGNLAPGESAQVWLSGTKKGTLGLAFTQKGNPMSGFQIADYDPPILRRDGLRMVLQIRPNEVTKFQDDESSTSLLGGLSNRIRDWVWGELSPLK